MTTSPKATPISATPYGSVGAIFFQTTTMGQPDLDNPSRRLSSGVILEYVKVTPKTNTEVKEPGMRSWLV